MANEKKNSDKKSSIQIKNRKASFDYFFIDTFTAGIVLTGTEIKSIRQGKASLVDTFCYIHDGEIWVKGMNITPYFYGSFTNHEAKRDRKLLLKKVNIALARGKKEYDKRQTLKEKEDRREMDRAIKRY